MLRKLTAEEVTFRFKCEQDEGDYKGHFDSGDPNYAEEDARIEREIGQRLDAGDVTAWCVLSVQADWHEFSGCNVLGGVSLDEDTDLQAFARSEGLFEEALADLNERLAVAEGRLELLKEPT